MGLASYVDLLNSSVDRKAEEAELLLGARRSGEARFFPESFAANGNVSGSLVDLKVVFE